MLTHLLSCIFLTRNDNDAMGRLIECGSLYILSKGLLTRKTRLKEWEYRELPSFGHCSRARGIRNR
jgi:hypothetical protein